MNVVLASRIGVFRSLWEHEDEEHERLLALIAAFFSTQDSWFHQPNAESCHAAMGCPLRGIASAHNESNKGLRYCPNLLFECNLFMASCNTSR